MVQVSQQGAQGSGSQVALQPMERTPASAEPIESDAMASVKVRAVPEVALRSRGKLSVTVLAIVCRGSPATYREVLAPNMLSKVSGSNHELRTCQSFNVCI